MSLENFTDIVNVTLEKMSDIVLCALVVWREARNQTLQCQAAVAHSILNRVHKPSWWGNDVTSVVFRKWQYSSVTDPKDRQLTTWPRTKEKSWMDCLKVVFDVMNGDLPNPVPGADSYYDTSISPPYWATPATFVKQIGKIRFHNLDADYESELLN